MELLYGQLSGACRLRSFFAGLLKVLIEQPYRSVNGSRRRMRIVILKGRCSRPSKKGKPATGGYIISNWFGPYRTQSNAQRVSRDANIVRVDNPDGGAADMIGLHRRRWPIEPDSVRLRWP